MRFIHLATLCGLAAQANASLVSVSDGTTITVSACEPRSYVVSSDIMSPNATTGGQISTDASGSAPDETGADGDDDDAAAALVRPVETSMAGLIGFFVVSLIVL